MFFFSNPPPTPRLWLALLLSPVGGAFTHRHTCTLSRGVFSPPPTSSSSPLAVLDLCFGVTGDPQDFLSALPRSCSSNSLGCSFPCALLFLARSPSQHESNRGIKNIPPPPRLACSACLRQAKAEKGEARRREEGWVTLRARACQRGRENLRERGSERTVVVRKNG